MGLGCHSRTSELDSGGEKSRSERLEERRQSFMSRVIRRRSNALLIFVPLSWTFYYVKLDNTLVFVSSILAVAPLAKLHALATNALSLRLGQTLAPFNTNLVMRTCFDPGLTRGVRRSVVLIIAVIALVKCELAVVQSYLLGSILSDLLLEPGMSLVAGGFRSSKQCFDDINAAQLDPSIHALTSGVMLMMLPTVFYNVAQNAHPMDGIDPLTGQQGEHFFLLFSHENSVFLLFFYLCHLLNRNRKNLNDDRSDAQQSIPYPSNVAERFHISEPASSSCRSSDGVMDPDKWDAGSEVDEEEEIEKYAMGLQMTIILLVVVTVLVCITAKVLIDSIDPLTSSGHVSKKFVSLVLLPMARTAEHVTATDSINDNTTRPVEVAVSSSMQIAFLAIPFVVIIGWILGIPLTVIFDPVESIVFFFSVLAVNWVICSKPNLQMGIQLVCLYVIMAVISGLGL